MISIGRNSFNLKNSGSQFTSSNLGQYKYSNIVSGVIYKVVSFSADPKNRRNVLN